MTLAEYVEAVDAIRKGRCACTNLLGGAKECIASRTAYDGFGGELWEDDECECLCHEEISELDDEGRVGESWWER